MLLLGGAGLRIGLTDVYLRYVKAGLRPYLIVAAVALILIGAITLWREIVGRSRADRVAASEDCDSEHGHHHRHGGPWVAWLLMLPVLAVFLIAPPSLGSYAAERSGNSVSAPVNSDYPSMPAGNPVPLTVLEYATRAVFEHNTTLRGRTVKLTGFISKREGGGVRLTRMILTCCAADARPVKITLLGEWPRRLEPDSWVTVEGSYDSRMDKDPSNGEGIPYLRVSAVHKVTKPADPYEG